MLLMWCVGDDVVVVGVGKCVLILMWFICVIGVIYDDRGLWRWRYARRGVRDRVCVLWWGCICFGMFCMWCCGCESCVVEMCWFIFWWLMLEWFWGCVFRLRVWARRNSRIRTEARRRADEICCEVDEFVYWGLVIYNFFRFYFVMCVIRFCVWILCCRCERVSALRFWVSARRRRRAFFLMLILFVLMCDFFYLVFWWLYCLFCLFWFFVLFFLCVLFSSRAFSFRRFASSSFRVFWCVLFFFLFLFLWCVCLVFLFFCVYFCNMLYCVLVFLLVVFIFRFFIRRIVVR